ncbi:MAG: hypothetical protein A3I70_07040 [Deltaproteobacteria bacterium RIFCSPLOWO2_02_FULL_44_34]|nr:MAG: hypothetical protein A3I70_07040 [Deltaproteobacteria bacterium RIFCSPLOWO2_02_FULL_44_34]
MAGCAYHNLPGCQSVLWKPAMHISRKQHFIDAALLWTITGSALGFFGMKWVVLGFPQKWALIWIGVCIAVGFLKGHFAIARSADRAIQRIQNFPERTPFFKVFGKGQWILVTAMMGLGMILRVLHVDKSYRGIVLSIVGVALLWASREFWKAACKQS